PPSLHSLSLHDALPIFPLGLLPHRHLRAPPGERPSAGDPALLAAHLQTPDAPRRGDDPAGAGRDRRPPPLLHVADDHAGGGGLRPLSAEPAAGAAAGRLPRPRRRRLLPAAALLVPERAGPGV